MSDAVGLPNVGSVAGYVERGARLAVWGCAAALVAMWLAAGCVETAECNATVPCPDGDICYDYECRSVCEQDRECGDGTRCVACMADDAPDDQGHCFGSEARACVPDEEVE